MKATIIDKGQKNDIPTKEYGLKELSRYLNNMTSLIGNHIRLEDNTSEYIADFLWIARNKWKIDCPIELNKVHKQHYTTKQEALQILEKIYYNHDTESLKGFIDVPIRHFTLDDMIEFKKEDEMMLKGQDPDLHKPTPTPSQKPETQEVSKSNISQKKKNKPSIILGDISVPKEKPRAKSTSSGITGKKPKTTTSPLKQFKASAAELKKEKKQPKTTKTPVKPVAKKANPPKSIPAKTDSTSLLNLEKTIEPKKVELTKASKTSKKKTKPQQTTTSKTNPKAPEQQPTIKPKKSKGKTLQTLGEPIAEKKKVAPKKSKPFNQQTSKKDTTKPNDDGFFSI